MPGWAHRWQRTPTKQTRAPLSTCESHILAGGVRAETRSWRSFFSRTTQACDDAPHRRHRIAESHHLGRMGFRSKQQRYSSAHPLELPFPNHPCMSIVTLLAARRCHLYLSRPHILVGWVVRDVVMNNVQPLSPLRPERISVGCCRTPNRHHDQMSY